MIVSHYIKVLFTKSSFTVKYSRLYDIAGQYNRIILSKLAWIYRRVLFYGFDTFKDYNEFLNVVRERDFFFGSVTAVLLKKSKNLSTIFSTTNYFKATISDIKSKSTGIMTGTNACYVFVSIYDVLAYFLLKL